MESKEDELRKLLSEISNREKRAYKRSLIAVILPLMLGATWLSYTTLEVKKRNLQVASLDDQIRTKTDELDQKQKQIEEKNREYDDLKLTITQVANSEIISTQSVIKVIESNPTAARSIPRIYIHIRANKQKERAKQIAEKLREEGYVVPGIEILVEKGPSNTQVRYFRKTEENEATEITNVIKDLGVNDVEKQYTTGYETSPVVRSRQYEIWFGHNSLGER